MLGGIGACARSDRDHLRFALQVGVKWEDDTSWQYNVSGAFRQCLVIVISCGPSTFGQLMGASISGDVARQIVLSGLAGGGLLFIAAACNTAAIQYIGLVGTCVGQLMVVAGIWGILLFGEMRGNMQ